MRKSLLFCLLLLLMGPLGYSAPAADFARITHPEKLVPAQPSAPVSGNEVEAKERASHSLANAPLLFIENKGQVANAEGNLLPQVLFTARSKGAEVSITATSITYTFSKVEGLADPMQQRMMPLSEREKKQEAPRYFSEQMTLNLVGANPAAQAELGEANAYFERFYMAHCPNGITARSFERVRIKEVYPGVDWVLYSNGSGLKYDFVLAKASMASQIKLKVTGAKTSIDAEGNLVMAGELGKIVEDKPVSFQNGREVASRFVQRSNGEIGFQLEGARADQPLTIDPSVVWATYSGTSGWDIYGGFAVDNAGNCYLGSTREEYYTRANNIHTNYRGYVTVGTVSLKKFSSTGTLLWTLNYGGDNGTRSAAVTTDGTGNIYVTGYTASPVFPVQNAQQPTLAGFTDAFAIKVDQGGNRLWATYLGGNWIDEGMDCAADGLGNLYVVGNTLSGAFPVMNAFQPAVAGSYDAFITKYNANGVMLWSTYYGGTWGESATCVATDAANNVIVAGETASIDFPLQNAFQTSIIHENAFFLKMDASGNRLWATLYGGNGSEYPYDCKFDTAGDIVITGGTGSTTLPLLNADLILTDAAEHGFLAKVSSAGSLLFSTYIGGGSADGSFCCDVDANNNIYVGGVALNYTKATDSWDYIGFIGKYASNGEGLWTYYYPGNSDTRIFGLAIGGSSDLYVCFSTIATNLLTINANQTSLAGENDNYVMKLTGINLPFHLVVGPGQVQYGKGSYASVTVQNTGTLRLFGNTRTSAGHFTIESGGTLATNCKLVTGTGNFTLQTGATLEVCHPAGISASGATGAIQNAGTRTFATNSSYVFNGTAAQVPGNGMPATISNLTVNNAAGLTNSQPLNVSRLLTLTDGNFITGNQLTLTSNAQGAAMVANTSTGRITGLVNVQRYIKPSPFAGVAERYVSTPVAVQQLNQLSAVVGSFAPVLNTAYNNAVDKRAVTPYPNVFTYDHNRTITGGLYNGWYVPVGGMDPTRGYSLRVAGGTVLQTRGNLSLDSRTITGTNTTAEALLLLGNPFPNPIDWNFMSRTGIYNAYYTWQPTTGGAGRYASYVNGIGTYGATNIIPMGVGFFVSTSTTSPRLALPNACRVNSYANPSTFRQQPRPMLRLSMAQAIDTLLNYETVLYFDSTATAGFDGEKDAQHLGGSTSIYSHGNGQTFAINGQPLSLLNDGMTHTFPLGFTVANAGAYFIKASEMTELGGQPILLIDNQLQTTTLLQPGQSYQFQTPAGNNHSRFQIQLGYSATGAKASLSNEISIYPNPAKDRLEVSGLGSQASIRLLNSIGQQVVTTTASFSAMLDIEALAAGVYTLQIEQDGQVVNQRVVKQ